MSDPHSRPAHPDSAPESDARAIHALVQGLIDYAGLFPPAKLAMAASVKNYHNYANSDHAWMLGRFILPVSRLGEFEHAAAGLLPASDDQDPWPLSVLIDGDLAADLKAISAFNARHARHNAGLAVIDAVEIKVPLTAGSPSAAFIDDSLDHIADDLYPFFELPAPDSTNADIRGCLAVLADADAAAKIRTGGLTPDAIPASRAVAEFILACAAADVPFKATAGLHHAVRAEHPLTYEPLCPHAVMHGFLNVFIAAAFAKAARADVATLQRILDQRDPLAFAWSDTRLTFENLSLGMDQIEDARHDFALSYGSCSFDEPVQELQALKLI